MKVVCVASTSGGKAEMSSELPVIKVKRRSKSVVGGKGEQAGEEPGEAATGREEKSQGEREFVVVRAEATVVDLPEDHLGQETPGLCGSQEVCLQ